MDPEATLKRVLECMDKFEDADGNNRVLEALEAGRELIPALLDLDEAMRKGFWLPDRWCRAGAMRHP